MPFPPKPSKKRDDEDFERFAEMIRPIFLRMRLTDMLKMNPYAKYIKVLLLIKERYRKLKFPPCLLTILLKVGYLRNLEIQEYQLYHAPLKETMLKLLYVILEPVLVLCLSLYIVDLNWISWHLLKYLCKWLISKLLYLSVFVRMCLLWLQTLLS